MKGNPCGRGLYRSSAEKWFNPEDVTPPGSSAASSGEGLQSQLTAGKSGRLEIQFKIPQKLAPVFLAFKLVNGPAGGKGTFLAPARGSPHFAVPIGLQKGNPLKYGG